MGIDGAGFDNLPGGISHQLFLVSSSRIANFDVWVLSENESAGGKDAKQEDLECGAELPKRGWGAAVEGQ